MHAIPSAIHSAFAEFLATATSMEPFANAGGLSGANLFRVQTPERVFCLRQWPAEHPTAARLQAIHHALQDAESIGITFLAVPFRTAAGATFVRSEDRFWELAPWLPGQADLAENFNAHRLEQTLQAVARLHRCWRTQPWDGFLQPSSAVGPSPTYLQRINWLKRLLAGEAADLVRLVERASASPLQPLARSLCDLFFPLAEHWQSMLAGGTALHVPLQVCLKDLRPDHLLFVGDQLTGIIDYGAMNIDSVAADLARLLEELFADDHSRWEQALTDYASLRPLSRDEIELAHLLQKSSILLTGMQWIDWLFRERRQFPAKVAAERLSRACQRLQQHTPGITGNGPVEP